MATVLHTSSQRLQLTLTIGLLAACIANLALVYACGSGALLDEAAPGVIPSRPTAVLLCSSAGAP